MILSLLCFRNSVAFSRFCLIINIHLWHVTLYGHVTQVSILCLTFFCRYSDDP